MFERLKDVLVIAPHTDDAEFGCGGTISKMVSSGINVFIATFSACEKSNLTKLKFQPIQTSFRVG